MTFLPPFVLAQFMYLTQEQRFERLISYQQYLTLVEKPSLINRIDWFIERFAQNERIKEKAPMKQQMIETMLEEAKENIEDLTFILQEMKGRDLIMDQWLTEQLAELSTQADYEGKALLHEMSRLFVEINERIEQLQGEIDGESWNHQKW